MITCFNVDASIVLDQKILIILDNISIIKFYALSLYWQTCVLSLVNWKPIFIYNSLLTKFFGKVLVTLAIFWAIHWLWPLIHKDHGWWISLQFGVQQDLELDLESLLIWFHQSGQLKQFVQHVLKVCNYLWINPRLFSSLFNLKNSVGNFVFTIIEVELQKDGQDPSSGTPILW